MTASVGTPAFASLSSDEWEDKVKRKIFEIIAYIPELHLLKKVSVSEIIGERPKYSYRKNGDESVFEPDAGYVYHKSKKRIVGIPSVKWQKAQTNACQRVFKEVVDAYCLGLPLTSCLFVFAGPGFQKNNKGHISGSTGSVVEQCVKIGARVLVNPSDTELESEILSWIEEVRV